VAGATASGASLRFYGNGRDDIDRVKIRLDAPARPIDVGAGDFTLEFWLKALPGENGSGACAAGGDNWIYGNIVVDRDVYGGGDYGDFGVALAGGRIAFGVARGAVGTTVCGATDVADGAWHHIALTRRASDGQLRIFVDGRVDGTGTGPVGDVSYRDGRPTSYPNDPYLVLGAEKHDAGAAYPSYSGWLDEVRISRVVRYPTAFERPSGPFAPDGETVGLYHFNEGSGDTIGDSSGATGGAEHGSTAVWGDAGRAGVVGGRAMGWGGDGDRNSNSDGNRDGHGNGSPHRDAHADPDGDAGAYQHPDGDGDGHPAPDRHARANGHPFPHGRAHRVKYDDATGHASGDGYPDRHCHQSATSTWADGGGERTHLRRR
jgi:hypothetical protein